MFKKYAHFYSNIYCLDVVAPWSFLFLSSMHLNSLLLKMPTHDMNEAQAVMIADLTDAHQHWTNLMSHPKGTYF